jgi:hypothetical protein
MSRTLRRDWVDKLQFPSVGKFLTSSSPAQVESLLSTEDASKLSSRKLPIGNPKPENHTMTDTGDYWDDLEIDMILGDEMGGMTNQSSSVPTLPPIVEDPYVPNELIGFGLQENLPSQEIIDEL